MRRSSVSDHRPAAVGGKRERKARSATRGLERRRLPSMARTGPRVSLVTSPAHTRSQSAVERLGRVSAAGRLVEVGEERGASLGESISEGVVEDADGASADGGNGQQVERIAEVEGDSAIARTERARAPPRRPRPTP